MSSANQNLSQLESSGLIRLAQASPELEYLFRHALVQEAAYGSILKKDRKQLHLAVGEALERAYADRADELHGLLAYHYGRAEAWDRTLLHARAAADRAKRLYASAEALAFYDQALNALAHLATGGVDKEPRRENVIHHFDILSERHGVWSLLGQFGRARSDLEEMVTLARHLDDDSRLADTLNGLGNFYLNFGSGDPRAVLEEALAVKRRLGDLAGQADSLNLLSNIYLDQGEFTLGVGAFTEAHRLFETVGDPDGIARCEWAVGAITYEAIGDYESAISRLERALAITRQRGNHALECGSLMMMGAACVRLGDYDSARQHLNASLEIARQIGDRPAESWALLYLSWAERETGQFESGLQLIRRAEAIGRDVGALFQIQYALYSLARLYLTMDNPHPAVAALNELLGVRAQQYVWVSSRIRAQAALGRVYARLGNLDEAAHCAVEALRDMEEREGRGVAEVQAAYFDCYLALRQTDFDKASQALMRAQTAMLTLAGYISDENCRARFLNNVTVNREISAAWSQANE